MPKHLLLALALLFASASVRAQTQPVHVKLRIVLIDKDLNQKPVPFVVIRMKADSGSVAAVEAKTDLLGTAQLQVPVGHYLVTTAKPTDLGGKRYTWSFEADIKSSDQEIDLSNDNAKIESLASDSASTAGA